MRFSDKRYLDQRDVGRTRIVSKFALLPVTIREETRWLEKVKYEEIVEPFSREFKLYKWIPHRFID